MHRSLTLLAAPLCVLTLALPASAQSSPPPEVCPNVSYATTAEQQQGPPGEPVTMTFSSDVQPARTPDRWTLTRVSPGPEQELDSRPSGPSATFTVSPDETTTYRVQALGPDGCGPASATFTRTVTSGSPTPSPGLARQRCPSITRVLAPATVVSGQEATIEVQLSSPTPSNRVRLVRESPAPLVVVRSTRSDLNAFFTVRLGESHQFLVQVAPEDGAPCTAAGPTEARLLLGVRPVVSLDAVRRAPRDYGFSGRVLPGSGAVALYRVEDDGRRVLTSRAPVVDGRYRIDRRFLGSGRFGFVVVAEPGSGGRHVGGESRVRPTVVH